MKKLEINQTVYLKPINNLARRNKEIITATIQKIGRRYATLKYYDSNFTSEFDIERMVEKSNYSPNYEVYLSLEDAENSAKQPLERRKTIDIVSNLNYSDLIKVQEYIKKLKL